MERLVRQYRRVERLEAAQLANDQHRQRYLHYRYDEDGSLVIQAKLPPEVGALLKQAIEAAEEVLYREDRDAGATRCRVLHNAATLHNDVPRKHSLRTRTRRPAPDFT